MPNRLRNAVLLVTSLAAIPCEDPATMPDTTAPIAYSSNGGGFDFEPVASEAVCRPASTDPSYQPFDLQSGFRQQIIAADLEDFRPVAGRLASLSDCAAEPTGIHFNPSARTLWVNVQHAGGPAFNDLTIAISRVRWCRRRRRGRSNARGRSTTWLTARFRAFTSPVISVRATGRL